MFKDKYKKDNELIKPDSEKINEIKNNIILGHKKNKRKTPLIVAASFLFVIFSVFLFKDIILKDNNNNKTIASNTITNTNDYTKIYASLNKIISENKSNRDESAITNENTAVLEDSTSSSMKESSDYLDTNTQVTGVDEADIVKTDGKYIYYLSNNNIYISKINSGKVEIISKVRLNNSEEYYTSDIYLKDNKLIVLSQKSLYNETSSSQKSVYIDTLYGPSCNTYICVYDISNKEEPKLINTLSQNGSYSSSRMIDNKLYVITNYYLNEDIDKNEPKTFVPSTAINEEEKCLNSNDIYMCPNITSTNYVVVTCVDIENSSEFQSEKAILGSSNTVYMSMENLYLSSYDSENIDGQIYNKTNIIKFALNNGNIEFKTSKSIDGTLLNQFSMDEDNGYLRVVTTVNKYTETRNDIMSSIEFNGTINNLYILDSNLNITGSIENIAKGERVYSIRFHGDIGYFVTFKQVDPLFSVDLSNVNNPTILGQLKIPGFSEYMHPYKDNLLLGLGKEANENGELLGLKLSMFDTSDKTNLIEKHKLVLSDYKYSNIFYNHKALTILPDKNLIAFPCDNSYVIFEYSENNGFIEKKTINFTTLTNEYIYEGDVRGVYADDFLYICTPLGITSYSLDNFTENSNIVF